ncbi:MAG: metallophosphoesterase family protein [Oscillibacter sp.]|nr:metallophosphoesterase family protein [Oscillibacter sp.]
MKRVIVLSDTHGLLRPEVLEYLSRADVIIHGGDINTQAIVDKLREYGPLYIVRGNNDKEWAEGLPHSLTFAVEGVRFFLIHNKKDIPADLSDVDVVVYGHSHKYACGERDGLLWVNPGSCGRRRFNQEITLAAMTVDGRHAQAEKVTIPHEK